VLAMGRLFLLEIDDVKICIRKEDAARIEVDAL
jgi:Fe2+ transport system protein FeoA